jgi:hypothetical protein
MPYNLDLSLLSIQEYKELLKGQNLLPGRRMLWQDIDLHFKSIEKQGIADLSHLKKALSTPGKIASFAEASGISEEYLTLLKREMGSLEQKPVPLDSFPGMDPQVISGLHGRGINNSKEYWESGLSGAELFCLCDLVRVNGVGPVAAKAFYEAGYSSVADVAQANAEDMLRQVSEVNEAKHYYNAKLGAKDMQFCIDFASLLVRYGG